MTNPLKPSFRYPAALPAGVVHDSVAKAIQNNTNGMVDLNQAIVALHSRLDAFKAGSTTVATTGGSSSIVINGSAFAGQGGVNDQTGVTTYALVAHDNGILLILNDASPVAVSLNSGLAPPYFIFMSNFGLGDATLTPTSGLVNGAASLVMKQHETLMVVFDGTNWLTSADLGGTGVTGYIPVWTASNVLGDSHLDDGVTTAGEITSSEPLVVHAHSATGVGSAIDTAPTGGYGPTKTVGIISETSTDPATENGLTVALTLDPSASQTSFPAALSVDMEMNGANWSQGGAVFAGTLNYNGTGTGASAVPVVFAYDASVINTSSGEIGTAFGVGAAVINNGTGKIDQATNAQLDVYNNSPGGMDYVNNVVAYFETNAGTILGANGVFVQTPVLTGGSTITTRCGLYIQEQNASGIGTVYQIDSEGTSPSLFKGPIELPYTKAQTVYSAAGTPLPSAATAGVGARAFVSDATANVYGTAYASGGAISAPVYSDGVNWNMG